MSREDLVPVIEIDPVARAEDLTVKTIADLTMLEPFEMGNRGPILCVKGAAVTRRTIMNGGKHQKLVVEIGEKVDLGFSLDVNEWQGKKTVQLVLKDVKQDVGDEMKGKVPDQMETEQDEQGLPVWLIVSGAILALLTPIRLVIFSSMCYVGSTSHLSKWICIFAAQSSAPLPLLS